MMFDLQSSIPIDDNIRHTVDTQLPSSLTHIFLISFQVRRPLSGSVECTLLVPIGERHVNLLSYIESILHCVKKVSVWPTITDPLRLLNIWFDPESHGMRVRVTSVVWTLQGANILSIDCELTCNEFCKNVAQSICMESQN